MVRQKDEILSKILTLLQSFSAPAIFAIAFSVVKKFLNEYTLAKIQIYKNDQKKWKKVLREHIDGDNLPKYYGGDLVDPDGNPKYITKVSDILQELYLVMMGMFSDFHKLRFLNCSI